MRKGKTESILDLSMAITVHCCSLLTISQTFPLIISTPLQFQLQLPVLGRGMTHHFPGFCSSGVRNFSGNLPPGFRFSPTDEELFQDYLIPKRLGLLTHGIIAEIDLYRYNPGDIPGIDPTNKKLCDQVWYFFCIPENHNDDSFKRKAGSGFWKSTGQPRSVTAEGSDEEIGTVRILVFKDPKETHWVMHEFEHKAQSNSHVKDNYVLCRIRLQPNKKNKGVKRQGKSEPRCKTPNPKKKARKGKSNCNSASASMTHDHQSLGPVTSGNESLSQRVDIPVSHQRRLLISNSEEVTLQEKQTDKYGTLDISGSTFNFQGNGTDESICMPPNGGEAMSAQLDPKPAEAYWEALSKILYLAPDEQNESLSQGVDIPISHQRPLLISDSEEVTLQEKQTDKYGTLDASRSTFNFQGDGTDESILMPPNGGEAMSAQVDPELAEADWEAFKQLCEEILHSELAEADKEAFKQQYEEGVHSELAEADEEAFKQLYEELFTPDEQPISDEENPK